VWIWDVSSGRLLNAVQAGLDQVRKIAFNNDGSIIAIGSASEDIVLHDVETGQHIQLLERGIGRVANLSFSPEGDMLTSGAGLVSLWDVESGRLLGNLK
jgi:WD40 repeat protein